ncbi:MAG: winged helix-turn-helix domain-containing protein [Candidatus Micrarchaeales archaeon]|jgi:predicted transcriptional regulator
MSNSGKIVIKTISKPGKEDAKTLTDWFLTSFDLSNKGDEQEQAMFREIVSSSLKGIGTTSKALNEEFNLPLSTVIYHLNKFIGSGLVIRKGRRYFLRANDFETTIQELQAEMLTEFGRMMQFASKLDEIFEEEIHGRRKKGNR